ncbi:hypothetical protein ACJIZ3_001944 [Penstemon smallii]|uniref:Water stress and hypersensitive response domain-containing protein n=1 Tax=Penstemon smallii TaxID=265156 RepID=A0ABD3U6I8_9LAMI
MTEVEKKEQVKPLRPRKEDISDDMIHAAHTNIMVDTHKHDSFPIEFTTQPRSKCIKFCGCCAAIFLILVTILLVLMFTAFHVKDPILNLNLVDIEGVDVLNRTANFRPGLNLTIVAGVSIKNPNVASLKFSNTTMSVYYDGYVIGEARTPEGRARARKTVRINVTVDVMVDEVVKVPRFVSDLGVGMLPISMYMVIDGKVKIMDVIKRSVVVRMNCTMNVNVNSQMIQDWNCRRRVSL